MTKFCPRERLMRVRKIRPSSPSIMMFDGYTFLVGVPRYFHRKRYSRTGQRLMIGAYGWWKRGADSLKWNLTERYS